MMMSPINDYHDDIECSTSEEVDVVTSPDRNGYSGIILDCNHGQLKSAITNNLQKVKQNKSNVNHINFKTNHTNPIIEQSAQNNLKNNNSEMWKRGSNNSIANFPTNKTIKKPSNRRLTKEENDNPIKNGSNLKIDFDQETLNSKDSAKNASLEIQRLLENLGSHLQASISMRDQRPTLRKSSFSTESITPSFWDNPLCQNDLISAKINPVINNIGAKQIDSTKKVKRTSNVINSEMQAICKTIETCKKYDKRSSIQMNKSSDSDNESVNSMQNNIPTARSELSDIRNVIKAVNSPIRSIDNIKKSTSNINITGDLQFPSNFKAFRSFELNPYDDIIKAHLNPLDRRVKSVAAKNGCQIVIDGPINAYDPLSCQAFRNKVTYRCTMAGTTKENLDKCMNYLKETFPNTFLKVNARSG